MTLKRNHRLTPLQTPNQKSYFHCVSRVVDKRFIFNNQEKIQFLSLMRRYEAFCQVRVVGYCLMSNHFHLLVEVSARPDQRPSEQWLLQHTEDTLGKSVADQYRTRLAFWRSLADEAEKLQHSGNTRESSTTPFPSQSQNPHPSPYSDLEFTRGQADKVLADIWQRLHDVSQFIFSLKQQFSHWYNKENERVGTLWEERFRMVVVQEGPALAEVAAYLDLNPVRAGLVKDPALYRWCQYGAAAAGDALARSAVLFVAQCAGAFPNTDVSLLVRDWVSNQTSYRLLMYRRGLNRGELQVPLTLSPEEAEPLHQIVEAEPDGALIRIQERDPIGKSHRYAPRTVPRIDYTNQPIQHFTRGLGFGERDFLNELFLKNRELFSMRRQTGARKLRMPRLAATDSSASKVKPDFGPFRSLRDLSPKPARES